MPLWNLNSRVAKHQRLLTIHTIDITVYLSFFVSYLVTQIPLSWYWWLGRIKKIYLHTMVAFTECRSNTVSSCRLALLKLTIGKANKNKNMYKRTLVSIADCLILMLNIYSSCWIYHVYKVSVIYEVWAFLAFLTIWPSHDWPVHPL